MCTAQGRLLVSRTGAQRFSTRGHRSKQSPSNKVQGNNTTTPSEMTSVKWALSDPGVFQLLPFNEPATLLPPAPGSTSAAPSFSIPSSVYHAALDVWVPVTFGIFYVTAISMLNAYNRSTGNKPWRITRTKAFFCFVVVHNIFLAVYSGWTFQGLVRALYRTVSSGSPGLAGTIDSLCKLHGQPGLGNAIAYDEAAFRWAPECNTTTAFHYTATHQPSSTNEGRLWNEGLAFYGWIFYVSKFYEVVDTAIIIMKGKRSSTLQIYHHAGALLCMWSGIRYMSPPIWLWVAYNSGIHTMMYTYYTLAALSVPIPKVLKQGLTTMQIVQFLVGASYAAIHSFIAYTIPVQLPISNDAYGSTSHIEHHVVPCITTSGETFAIWFNVLYLTPLTVLFVRFFVKSYFRSTKGVSGSLSKKAR